MYLNALVNAPERILEIHSQPRELSLNGSLREKGVVSSSIDVH